MARHQRFTHTVLLVCLAASAWASAAASPRGQAASGQQAPGGQAPSWSTGAQQEAPASTRQHQRDQGPALSGAAGAPSAPPAAPDCTTPSRTAGHCIRLQACKPLLALLRTARYSPRGMPDAEVTMLLRKSHCGFQGNTVMVCCPDDGQVLPVAAEPSALSLGGAGYGGAATPAPDSSLAFTDHPSWQSGGASGGGYEAAGSTSAPEHVPEPLLLIPAEDGQAQSQGAQGQYGGQPDEQPAQAVVQPLALPDYPLDNLALLPTEVCGLSMHRQYDPEMTNRTGIMQYPWIARLGYKRGDRVEYLCSGSLISERYVLTAAHCLQNNGPVSVRLGESDTIVEPDCMDRVCAPAALDVEVEEKTAHDNHHNGVNDIALLRLARPVPFSEAVRPICLPIPVRNRPEEEPVGKSMTVAGWGNTSPNRRQNAPSRWLHHFSMQVTNPSACQAAYNALDDVHFDGDKHLCVSSPAGRGCHGDSGSPLMSEAAGADVEAPLSDRSAHTERRTVLYGVLSYGLPDCALRSAPLAFTRVSRYVPWVLRVLKPNPFVPKDRTSGTWQVDPRGGTVSKPGTKPAQQGKQGRRR